MSDSLLLAGVVFVCAVSCEASLGHCVEGEADSSSLGCCVEGEGDSSKYASPTNPSPILTDIVVLLVLLHYMGL